MFLPHKNRENEEARDIRLHLERFEKMLKPTQENKSELSSFMERLLERWEQTVRCIWKSLFGLPKQNFKVHGVLSRTHLRNKEEE